MTKTVIAIRHVHFEDLGAFDDVLHRHGYAVRYCDACIDDIAGVAIVNGIAVAAQHDIKRAEILKVDVPDGDGRPRHG